MTTFLVLTDFSAAARSAVQFAGVLSRKIGAKLILLHAVPRHYQWLGDCDDELVREALQQLDKAKRDLVSQGLPAEAVDIKVINQFPLHAEARDYVKATHASLIVMGTGGTMGKGNPTLGSFALEVVENMPVPMIAVPADAPASGISQIIYATDMQQLFVEMSILVPYARAFGAAVHILHIKPPGDQKVPAANDLVAQLQGQHAYNRISFTVRTGNDPEAAIHRFAREQEADLLAVFARPKNIFEKMFSKSITEQISHHTRIPLFLFRT